VTGYHPEGKNDNLQIESYTRRRFNTFGISAFCGKKLIKSVSGISESFRQMTELVEMCNELELELCQLDDIIEDYLTDFTL